MDLLFGSALATSNDGAGVTHAAARGRGLASNEAKYGQLAVVVGSEPGSGLLLGLTTDLADHDDALGLGVVDELAQAVDEVGAVEGVATNAHDGGLAKASSGSLVDGLVGEGARARDDANLAGHMDVTRHDSDFAFARLNNAGTVRADETSLVLRAHDGLHLDHVESGNALGDAHNEVHLSLDGLQDGVGGERRRDINNRSFSVGGLLGI